MTLFARDTGTQLVGFIRKTINLNTLVLSSTHTVNGTIVEIGAVPSNALIVGDGIYISLAPSGTTNTLDVGYSSDALGTASGQAYASALAIPITTGLGRVAFDELGNTSNTGGKRANDTTLTVTYKGTGTTGVFDVVVQYVLDK